MPLLRGMRTLQGGVPASMAVFAAGGRAVCWLRRCVGRMAAR
jgi:hypothetical protein